MAATPARETPPPPPPPPPVIGKAGRYTVFITPPATPQLLPEKTASQIPLTPVKAAPLPAKSSVAVQVPPPQFEKPAVKKAGSAFGFLRDAAEKVQNVHASLDEYLADWLGLNQSKYQWALNDYYENTGLERKKDSTSLGPTIHVARKPAQSKDCGKPKEFISKDQTV